MCISSNASIISFLLFNISAFILIFYGKKEYRKENLIVGMFFIYVSIVQIIDFLIWNDLNNKKNWNQIASSLCPLIIFMQPVFLYLLKYIFYKKTNRFWDVIFLLYFLLVCYKVGNYWINNKNKTSKEIDGHIQWDWTIKIDGIINPLYIILLFVSVVLYMPIEYGILFFIIGFIFMKLSYYMSYHFGAELWCYTTSINPILIFIGTFFINDIKKIIVKSIK